MALSSVVAIAGIGLAWMFYVASPKVPGAIASAMKPLYLISQGKFFLDEILKALVVLPLVGIAKLATVFDRGVIDCIVDSIGAIPRALSSIPRQFHTGVISSYAGFMWAGVVAAVVLVLTMF
jgi:NADH-quinone oxidoreductase subunit L